MGRKAEREKRKRRKEFEFPQNVKNDVAIRSKGVCEHCKEQAAVEYHHKISIGEARQQGFDIQMISSAENCLHVCHECHKILD